MKSLKQKPKVEVARQFVGVVYRDKRGRPKVCTVPGSDGKQYQVIIRRYQFASGDQLVTTECRLDVGRGYLICLGNTCHKKLCYHSQASIDYALSEVKKVGAWCDNYEDALKLNHMKKGQIIKVKSHQGRAEMFVVVTEIIKRKL